MKALSKSVSSPKVLRLNTVESRPQKALAIKTQEGIRVVPVSEVSRIEADGNYCYLHQTSGRRITISKTLKTVSELLPEKHFLRPHASHLIRLSDIRMVATNELTLSDNTLIPIARSRRKYVVTRLSEFTTFL